MLYPLNIFIDQDELCQLDQNTNELQEREETFALCERSTCFQAKYHFLNAEKV
jgi:hypothetical protein